MPPHLNSVVDLIPLLLIVCEFEVTVKKVVSSSQEIVKGGAKKLVILKML